MSEFMLPPIDRSGWAPGPWDDEPDRVNWVMAEPPHYRCMMLRNECGAWCGYVALPIRHAMVERDFRLIGFPKLDAHGGVNFSQRIEVDGETFWCIGFDCMHVFDGCPGLLVRGHLLGEYRDVSFVRAAVEHLARQLAEVQS